MKKIASALLLSCALVLPLCGCGSGTVYQASQNSATKTVEISQNSQTEEFTNEGYKNNPQYNSAVLDISDDNMKKSKVDLSEPVVFTISNVEDMENFQSKYETTYSLNNVDSGETFNEITKDFNAAYFDSRCVVVILTSYKKGTESNAGMISYDGKTITLDYYAAKPADGDDVAFGGEVISIMRDDLGKKGNPEIKLNRIDGEEITEDPGDAEIITDDGETSEEPELLTGDSPVSANDNGEGS